MPIILRIHSAAYHYSQVYCPYKGPIFKQFLTISLKIGYFFLSKLSSI